MSKYPGVYLAGLAYDGVGLPDCVASAKTMVEEIAIQHGHEQSNA